MKRFAFFAGAAAAVVVPHKKVWALSSQLWTPSHSFAGLMGTNPRPFEVGDLEKLYWQITNSRDEPYIHIVSKPEYDRIAKTYGVA